MTVQIYDRARIDAASGLFKWVLDDMVAVIPRTSYQPQLDLDTALSVVGPVRGTAQPVLARTVDSAGWLGSAPIFFSPAVIDGIVDKVVIYRSIDEVLIFVFSFPGISDASNKGITIPVGVGDRGYCRL